MRKVTEKSAEFKFYYQNFPSLDKSNFPIAFACSISFKLKKEKMGVFIVTEIGNTQVLFYNRNSMI